MNGVLAKKIFCKLVLILTLLILTAGMSDAASFYLRAERFLKAMPDGTSVAMWGFSSCDAAFTTCGAPDVPGPVLDVPFNDAVLEVTVLNTLTEPVSIVIPGQSTALSPVTFTDAAGRTRVRSFTHETASSAQGTYTWSNVSPGSYIYHSGSHAAVQVQMGLYGAVKKNSDAGNTAYSGVTYDAEAMIFLSEVDPALHAAVDGGTYGPGNAVTSTLDYNPKYFLINGTAYSAASPPAIPAGSANAATLLRFYNAGIKTHVLNVPGMYMNILSEDGNLYPYPKQQYSLILQALKTKDAVITPGSGGSYAVMDRRLFLTNNASSPGGMLTFLNVAP